jgi:hypothetical protein
MPPEIDEVNPVSVGATFGPGNPIERDAEYPFSPTVDDTVATDPVIESACAERFSEIIRTKSGSCPIAMDDVCPITPAVRTVGIAPARIAAAVPVIWTVTITDEMVIPGEDIADCASIGIVSVEFRAPPVAALSTAVICTDCPTTIDPSAVPPDTSFKKIEPACEEIMVPLDMTDDVPAIPIACAGLTVPPTDAADIPVTACVADSNPPDVVAMEPVNDMDSDTVESVPLFVVPVTPDR